MSSNLNGTVTDGDRNAGGEHRPDNGTPAGTRVEDQVLARGSAPLRLRPRIVAGVVFRFLCSVSRHLSGYLVTLCRRILGCAPYEARPASVRDVVQYTAAGGWVPGEHPWWVEAPGRVYGVLIAVPLTMIANAVLWVTQRPTRAAVTSGVVVVALWTAGARPEQWWVYLVCGYLACALLALVMVATAREPG